MALLRILSDGTIEQLGSRTIGYRAVQATAPATTGWSNGDLWLDTSYIASTGEPKIRVFNGSSFSTPSTPGSGVDPSVLLTEDFTGTDGAEWNSTKWIMGRNHTTGTGGGVKLLAGVGVLQTSTDAPDKGGATVSRRANIANTADVNLACSFKFDSTRAYFDINVRHDTDQVDGNNCYSLRLRSSAAGSGGQVLAKQISYNTTSMATKNQTFTNGTWYRVRFQALGTTIRTRIWEQGATEPGTWDMSVTDSTFTGAGKVGLCGRNGTASARVFVDDFILRNAA